MRLQWWAAKWRTRQCHKSRCIWPAFLKMRKSSSYITKTWATSAKCAWIYIKIFCLLWQVRRVSSRAEKPFGCTLIIILSSVILSSWPSARVCCYKIQPHHSSSAQLEHPVCLLNKHEMRIGFLKRNFTARRKKSIFKSLPSILKRGADEKNTLHKF